MKNKKHRCLACHKLGQVVVDYNRKKEKEKKEGKGQDRIYLGAVW